MAATALVAAALAGGGKRAKKRRRMRRKTVKVCDHYQKEIFQPAGPYIPV